MSVAAPATAGDVVADLMLPWSVYSPYAGIGVATVHHTGWLPSGLGATESWVTGSKLFLGAHFTPVLDGEVTYYDFGNSLIDATGAIEDAKAVSATLLAHHRFARYPFWDSVLGYGLARSLDHVSIFGKSGLAYKWIDQTAPTGGSMSESGVTYVLGFGAETELNHSLFARFDYDYISKIGTSAVINAQHTAIAATVGVRF